MVQDAADEVVLEVEEVVVSSVSCRMEHVTKRKL